MTDPAPFYPSIIDQSLALFALGSSREFGERVAQTLGMALSPHEEREFEDGEHKARPLAGVRGKDVYVIHSLYSDRQQSVNDKLCRLLFFIGALKDAGAARVSAVVPYLAYARKDWKSKPRDPVTTRYVASLFEAVGTDVVMTMDVHNVAAYQNAFRCRTEHLDASELFVRQFSTMLTERQVVVVSPDAGGIKRAEHFRRGLTQMLGVPVGTAFAEKYRSEGIVTGDLLVGDVKGKDAIVIDDLISTGTTIARAARACVEQGAARVIAAATHGLFTGEANTVLADSAVAQIVVTDTVPSFRLVEGATKEKVRTLSSTTLFAESIRRLHAGESPVEPMAS